MIPRRTPPPPRIKRTPPKNLNITVDLESRDMELPGHSREGRVSVGERVAALDPRAAVTPPAASTVAPRTLGSKAATSKRGKLEGQAPPVDPVTELLARARGPFDGRMEESALHVRIVNGSMAVSRNLRSDLKRNILVSTDRTHCLLGESEREIEGLNKENKRLRGVNEEMERERTDLLKEVERLRKENETFRKIKPVMEDGKTKEARKTEREKDEIVERMERVCEVVMKSLKGHEKALGEHKIAMETLQAAVENAPIVPSGEGQTGHPQFQELKELAADIKGQLTNLKEDAPTYAQALARSPIKLKQMHSLIISPSDELETSSQTIEHIKEAVKARQSGVRIERVRKVRDGRVVISCASEEELRKVEAQLCGSTRLKVEQATNKRPLVVLKNLLAYNSDEDIEAALHRQNKELMEALSADEAKVEVRYRRRARNPLECHAVLRVSPKLWQRLTSAGRVYIDLQSVKVQDQSPLVQCTRCLGFGHGRKLCTEAVDLCNFCGGPHLKSECTQLLGGQEPSCKNCTRAGLTHAEHMAFSDVCPVRKKWDALARSSVAYY